MNCEEFEAQLNALLDERTPLAELPQALREAAANDPACAKILRAYQALESSMRSRPLPQPSTDLAARVLAELSSPASGAAANNPSASSAAADQVTANQPNAENQPNADEPATRPAPVPTSGHPRRRLPWNAPAWQALAWKAVALSAAAAAVVIAVVYLAGRPADQPNDSSNVVRRGTPEGNPGQEGGQPTQRPEHESPRQESHVPPSAFASLSELAQRQYESLAAEAKAGLSDVGVLVPRYGLEAVQVAEAPVSETPASDVPAPESPEESVDRLGPFKESTRGAFGLLMRFTPR